MSSMDGTTWRVDSQSQRTRANAVNGVEDGMEIAFTTGLGNSGTVFVPMSRYRDLAYVKGAIQEAAVQVDTVGALTHATEV